MTSDIRVHDPEWDKGSKSRTPLKCYYIFLTYADILTIFNFKFEISHIQTFGNIHGRLPLNNFRQLGPCPRVGLEVKI